MPNDIQDRLRELAVFSAPSMTLGVPSKLFWTIVFLAGGEGAILHWWIGLLLFIGIYAPMYRAHRTDPNAAAVWAAVLVRRIVSVDPTRNRDLKVRYL
jgi:hypothetical protein